jgi:hypothetical protein
MDIESQTTQGTPNVRNTRLIIGLRIWATATT